MFIAEGLTVSSKQLKQIIQTEHNMTTGKTGESLVWPCMYSAWILLLHLESDDKPNIWQMKKKERKDFRRKQDENYDLVHNLKQLYETIRRFVNLGIWMFKVVGNLADCNLRTFVPIATAHL